MAHSAELEHSAPTDESSNSYESAEDSAYRPPPCEDEEDEEVTPPRKKKVGSSSRKKIVGSGPSRRRYQNSRNEQEAAGDNDDDVRDANGEQQIAQGASNEEGENSEDGGRFSYQSEELREPISSSDDEIESRRASFPQFNAEAPFGEVRLVLGMEFKNLSEFKQAVKDYNIHLGRQIKWLKNDKVRASAKCVSEQCSWEIYCSQSNVTNSFQIKTLKGDHSCPRTFRNTQADKKWVVQKLEARLRQQPNLSHSEAYYMMKEDFGVHLEDNMIYRSLKQARENIEGSEIDQYAKLWDYCNELLRSNPGSTVKMDTIPQPEGPPQFQRLYICFDACKRGFKAGCRPMIGLDGCFLKGYFGGQLLSAVGGDANNHIYIIAYAIVDSETKDNWKWFLELLHQDLGDYTQHGWQLVSDMQKGLIPAVQEVMPEVEHRFCVMHLWKNFIKVFKDKELRDSVWLCARCTTPQEFNIEMDKVKHMNKKAWEYLNKFPPNTWSRAHFSMHPKVDTLCNNNCEVFNGKIVKYRGKPILKMAEEIRCYIMRNMSSNKRSLNGWLGELTPIQQKRLDKEKIMSNKWTAIWAGDDDGKRFEVQRWDHKMDVDLNQHTCTCRFWQLIGMPCKHAIAAMAFLNLRPEDYVHPWLKMLSFTATYEHFLRPCQSQEFWEATGFIGPIPPIIKRKPGRPKKARRRDEEDNTRPDKLSKKTSTMHCKRCGSADHNVRRCPQPAPETESEPQPEPPNDQDAIEINLSQSAPVSQQPERENNNVSVPAATNRQTFMSAPEATFGGRLVRPPPLRPSVVGLPTASRIPGRGLLRRTNTPFRPVAAVSNTTFRPVAPGLHPHCQSTTTVQRPSSPVSMPAGSEGEAMGASRDKGSTSMLFMPTPRLNNNRPEI